MSVNINTASNVNMFDHHTWLVNDYKGTVQTGQDTIMPTT